MALQTHYATNLIARGTKMDQLSEIPFTVFGDGVSHLHGNHFLGGPSLEGSPYFTKQEYHYFERSFFAYMWNFAMNSNGTIAYIYGASGTGKTSGVEQFFARLNWETVIFNASKRKELIDLEGSWMPQANGMEFFEGVLIECMTYGYALIINEISLMDAGEIAGLNDIKPGKIYTLSSKGGEKILVHPNFRLIVTDNTNGSGSDATGSYTGTKKLNGAFLDRCRGFDMQYLPQKEEVSVLKQALGFITSQLLMSDKDKVDFISSQETLLPVLVELANETRREVKNRNLSFPLTTRSLIDTLLLCGCYRALNKPLKDAIDQTYLWRLKEIDRPLVENLINLKFGPVYDQVA